MKRLLVLGMTLLLLLGSGCYGYHYYADSKYLFHIPLLEGDCVDRAIQVKKTLIDQGYEAKVVLGFVTDPKTGHGYAHAWIKYRKSGDIWREFDELFTDNERRF